MAAVSLGQRLPENGSDAKNKYLHLCDVRNV